MFSLCIATVDRYDTFLKKSLEQYIQFPLIDEIVISDENGKDAAKIQKEFIDTGKTDKIRVLVNDKRLGPFMNKLKAMKEAKNGAKNGAKNNWIAIIDSDNFAPSGYFNGAKAFIESNGLQKGLLMPSFAKPRFSYKAIVGKVELTGDAKRYEMCFNTGNYILSKDLLALDLSKEEALVSHSDSCDVILFNTLLIEQYEPDIYVVEGMEYDHVVHKNSAYLEHCKKEKDYNLQVSNRFKSLFWNLIPSNLFYVGNKDTYPPFKKGRYLEEYFLERCKQNPRFSKGRKYIPALWTNFQIEAWFPRRKKEMQQILNKWVASNPSRHGYFTVVQYDDACLLQLPPDTKVFGACSGDEPIPLIYEDTDQTLEKIPRKSFAEKEILCSFVGSMTSNQVQPNVRMEIKKKFEGNSKFHLKIGSWTNQVQKGNQDSFIETTVNSKFALAPRGYGRSSFRFFEVLQLGTIPVYVWNDVNWLPFQDKIKYTKFCVVAHVSQMDALEFKLDSITETKYQEMLGEYEKIKHFFTLEGMYEEILHRI